MATPHATPTRARARSASKDQARREIEAVFGALGITCTATTGQGRAEQLHSQVLAARSGFGRLADPKCLPPPCTVWHTTAHRPTMPWAPPPPRPPSLNVVLTSYLPFTCTCPLHPPQLPPPLAPRTSRPAAPPPCNRLDLPPPPKAAHLWHSKHCVLQQPLQDRPQAPRARVLVQRFLCYGAQRGRRDAEPCAAHGKQGGVLLAQRVAGGGQHSHQLVLRQLLHSTAQYRTEQGTSYTAHSTARQHGMRGGQHGHQLVLGQLLLNSTARHGKACSAAALGAAQVFVDCYPQAGWTAYVRATALSHAHGPRPT